MGETPHSSRSYSPAPLINPNYCALAGPAPLTGGDERSKLVDEPREPPLELGYA
jgi:hypothetical protein